MKDTLILGGKKHYGWHSYKTKGEAGREAQAWRDTGIPARVVRGGRLYPFYRVYLSKRVGMAGHYS